MRLSRISYFILLLSLLAFRSIFAAESVVILSSKFADQNKIPKLKVNKIIEQKVDMSLYRTIKVQVIYHATKPEHLLVYLFSKQYHRVDLSRINIDSEFNPTSGLMMNYHLTPDDLDQQPGTNLSQVKCPDPSIEFIAFAPNDDDLEQDITIDVGNYASAHHLKTIQLLKGDATRANYLNYMTCPKLKGNFYDGDANIEEIVTVDGLITYRDINKLLRNQFRFKVTNIWLACQAYNDPIKSSVIVTAQTQKYAAGINNLLVGPSDRAAACAMKKAIDGKPMESSFNDCYALYDTPDDKWGFGGYGSDYFGT